MEQEVEGGWSLSQRNHRKLSSSFGESRDSLLSGNCDGRGSREVKGRVRGSSSSHWRVLGGACVTWADEVPPVLSLT